MRILCLFALAALVACSHAVIPGTNVRDDPENRAVLEVVARYKQAMEARDASALLALAAPGYFDPGDPSRPTEPRDLEGLRKSVPKNFSDVRALKLDMDIRNVKVEGDRAQVDFFGVLRYAVAVPNGEKWFTEADDARIKLAMIDGAWKIVGGL